MSDELGYDINEKIIRDGAILAEFKNSHYWPVVKGLIESEIRACFRAFTSESELVTTTAGEKVEHKLSDDDLKSYRSRALGAKAILEMIDGKIGDMEVWVADQQRESDDDLKQVDEIFSHNRNRQQEESFS